MYIHIRLHLLFNRMGGDMNEEATTSTPAPEMSAMQKVIGIFTAPRQTFEAIDQKPTWVLPFLISPTMADAKPKND